MDVRAPTRGVDTSFAETAIAESVREAVAGLNPSFEAPRLASAYVPSVERMVEDASRDDEPTLPNDAKVRMTRAVQALALDGGDALVELVVAYDSANEVEENDRVAALGGSVVATYKHLPMRAIRVPADALVELAQNDAIRLIDIDAPVMATSVAMRETADVPGVGAPHFVGARSDVTVAVIDSGVTNHNDYVSRRQFRLHGWATTTSTTVARQIQKPARISQTPKTTLAMVATSLAPSAAAATVRTACFPASRRTHRSCRFKCSMTKARVKHAT